MKILNKLALASVVLAMFFGGCGKKKNEKPTTKAKTEKVKKVAQSDQMPMLKEDSEGLLLEDGGINEFALADEPKTEKTQTVAKNETAPIAFTEVGDEATVEKDAVAPVESEKVAFNTVFFDFNRNEIRPDQEAIVEADIKAAKESNKSVVLKGNTCQIGSERYNLALSEQRALTVKEKFVEAGIPADRIKTVGCGYENPVVEVASDSSDRSQMIKELAPNRRVEFETIN